MCVSEADLEVEATKYGAVVTTAFGVAPVLTRSLALVIMERTWFRHYPWDF